MRASPQERSGSARARPKAEPTAIELGPRLRHVQHVARRERRRVGARPAIADWQALSALNEKPILDALDDLIRAGAPRRELSALRSAIELQLGYEIFAAVDATKIGLSTDETAFLTFHHADVDIDAVVSRRRFEVQAAPLLAEIDALLTEVLVRASLTAERIGEVVMTGGSSGLPAARALLARRFPDAVRRDFAAFSSVATGLALGA